MKREVFAVVATAILPAVVFAGSDSVKYQGGTLSIQDGSELRVNLTAGDAAVFAGKAQAIRIPWSGVKSIEYGQTASRRVTSAILLSSVALFSKARKHYVSVEWTDEQGQAQAVSLRADKNNFRSILTALRAKSGQTVICGDVEAAKYFPCENSAELMTVAKK
jgi:hypothetical protein